MTLPFNEDVFPNHTLTLLIVLPGKLAGIECEIKNSLNCTTLQMLWYLNIVCNLWMNLCLRYMHEMCFILLFSLDCRAGQFGPNCLQFCDCLHEAPCNATDGTCYCPPGWVGSRCEKGRHNDREQLFHEPLVDPAWFLVAPKRSVHAKL